MSVIAFHVRAICSFHFLASPEGTTIEGDPVNDTFGIGAYGVQLFFIISGFILSLPFARQWMGHGNRVRLKDYYIRRVTRIEPPYLIHLVFLFALCALVLRRMPVHPNLYQNPDWAKYALEHILASMIYAHGFIFGTHGYPNIVLWSLAVEVQFYLLAPFLASVFRIADARIRRGLLAVLIVIIPFLVMYTPHSMFYQVNFSLLGSLQFFLTGFLLADLYMHKAFEGDQNHIWDLVFPAVLITAVVFRHWDLMSPVALPWMMLLCCVAAFRGVWTAKILSLPWIVTIGGMCYTIYMYHMLMISLLVRITGLLRTHILWLDLLIQFVLMSAIIIAVCSVLFALFERPFMRRDWPARFWKKFVLKEKITN